MEEKFVAQLKFQTVEGYRNKFSLLLMLIDPE